MKFTDALQKAIIILLGIFSSSIPIHSQINAEQVLTIGRNILSLDDYMLSIQYFNQAIKSKPYLAEPYFFRGLAKLYLEDYKGAESDCSLALQRNGFMTEAYKVRGFARQSLGKDSLAIEDYNKGLKYNPIDRYFLFYKAVAQTSLKKDNEAKETYQTLLQYFPKFEDAYTGRAHVYLAEGDTIAAINDIDQSLSLNHNQIEPYMMKAEIYWKQKNWQSSLDNMNEAITLKPNDANLYVNRAYLRYNLDDYFGAMSDYNYAIELEPFNSAATFNRALLRYEVRDLKNAAADFSQVLKWDSSNFHARYNRGLIYLESGEYNKAISDFHEIAKQYPRYYPIYYAIAEAKYNLGDQKGYIANIRRADDLIRAYVKNPTKNKLDRPTIEVGTTNDKGSEQNETESEVDVMNRFNQLVTISASNEQNINYNDKTKGRIQDRNVKIELEPLYALSFYDTTNELRNQSNYFRELDNLNQSRLINRTVYLSNISTTPTDTTEINNLFSDIENYTAIIAKSHGRPVDYFGRALTYLTLKNYEASISDLDKAIEQSPEFTVAYMMRAYARQCAIAIQQNNSQTTEQESELLLNRQTINYLTTKIIADYDKAIELNPQLIYAWYNKGNLLFKLHDYTSSLACYNKAIEINPEFGQAYYNRGLIYLQMGNKAQGISDLSKAGELGVLPSYNVLKRMK